MKKSFLFLLFSLLCVWSCGQKSTETKASASDSTVHEAVSKPSVDLTIPSIPADYVKIDLSKIGLNAKLMVPPKADTQQSTIDDNEGKRNLFIVYPFHVITGDSRIDGMGGISAEIDICTTEWTLQQHKDFVKFSSISRWNKFAKEEEDYCIYTTDPTNSLNQPLRAKDEDVYQFIMIAKSKTDNKQYVIRSSPSYDFTSEEMLKLLAIAKSIEL